RQQETLLLRQLANGLGFCRFVDVFVGVRESGQSARPIGTRCRGDGVGGGLALVIEALYRGDARRLARGVFGLDLGQQGGLLSRRKFGTGLHASRQWLSWPVHLAREPLVDGDVAACGLNRDLESALVGRNQLVFYPAEQVERLGPLAGGQALIDGT